MHMMSKKDLSSDELDTLRRSRNPTTVTTAKGKVQTNEEAQVSVHDLNLFVTVQLLEETLAVLSLGKPCEDHGYSNEWVSGQKPRLTKEGKTTFCKTDNFVPLVVPGLSTNPGCNSSSTFVTSTSGRFCLRLSARFSGVVTPGPCTPECAQSESHLSFCCEFDITRQIQI